MVLECSVLGAQWRRHEHGVQRRDTAFPLPSPASRSRPRCSATSRSRSRRRAARDGFEREDAAAGEEVEEVRAGDARADDVEERLPGALGGGADIVRRNGNAAAAERACGDAERPSVDLRRRSFADEVVVSGECFVPDVDRRRLGSVQCEHDEAFESAITAHAPVHDPFWSSPTSSSPTCGSYPATRARHRPILGHRAQEVLERQDLVCSVFGIEPDGSNASSTCVPSSR